MESADTRVFLLPKAALLRDNKITQWLLLGFLCAILTVAVIVSAFTNDRTTRDQWLFGALAVFFLGVPGVLVYFYADRYNTKWRMTERIEIDDLGIRVDGDAFSFSTITRIDITSPDVDDMYRYKHFRVTSRIMRVHTGDQSRTYYLGRRRPRGLLGVIFSEYREFFNTLNALAMKHGISVLYEA